MQAPLIQLQNKLGERIVAIEDIVDYTEDPDDPVSNATLLIDEVDKDFVHHTLFSLGFEQF